MPAPVKQGSIDPNNVVRISFISYLKSGFPYENNWYHPLNKKEYQCDEIKVALLKLKGVNQAAYSFVYQVMATNHNKQTLADKFYVSRSTLDIAVQKAIDSIMLMLIHPELAAEALNQYHYR